MASTSQREPPGTDEEVEERSTQRRRRRRGRSRRAQDAPDGTGTASDASDAERPATRKKKSRGRRTSQVRPHREQRASSESSSPRQARKRRKKAETPPGALSANAQRLIDSNATVDEIIEAGETARKSRHIEDARALFLHALDREPAHVGALLGLGFSFLEVEDYTHAATYLERALDEKPSDERGLYAAALAWLGQEEFDTALSYALRLCDSEAYDSRRNGHFIAGKALYESGSFERATDEFEQAIALESRARGTKKRRKEETRFLLAQAYLALGDKNKALKWLRGLSKRRSILDQIGRLCLELDRISEAKEAFEQILSKTPEDQRALRGLGQVHLNEHRYDDAIRVFTQVFQLNRGSIHALEGMAEAYKGKGDLSRAARYVEQMRGRSNTSEVQLERRLRAVDRERARRDAELLRVRHQQAPQAMGSRRSQPHPPLHQGQRHWHDARRRKARIRPVLYHQGRARRGHGLVYRLPSRQENELSAGHQADKAR